MTRTPGFIVPSAYSSKAELEKDLKRRGEAAGFTPFEVSDFSENDVVHFGILGMRWGQTKSEPSGVSRKTSREAEKDSKEFARAKMFFGEGAGTRRKLIKATVEAKSKKDPDYKKAFDHHLSNQDMSTHASKARGERKRKNVVNSTTKTARGIRNVLNGNARYASLASAMLVGGAMYAHKTGIDKVVFNAAKRTVSSIRKSPQVGMNAFEWLKGMGIKP